MRPALESDAIATMVVPSKTWYCGQTLRGWQNKKQQTKRVMLGSDNTGAEKAKVGEWQWQKAKRGLLSNGKAAAADRSLGMMQIWLVSDTKDFTFFVTGVTNNYQAQSIAAKGQLLIETPEK
jgi:hypothetical protein